MGESIDWEVILSLKEPSMPREANELVKECYVWHYQTMRMSQFVFLYILLIISNLQIRSHFGWPDL